jgi:hypothetical protein
MVVVMRDRLHYQDTANDGEISTDGHGWKNGFAGALNEVGDYLLESFHGFFQDGVGGAVAGGCGGMRG